MAKRQTRRLARRWLVLPLVLVIAALGYWTWSSGAWSGTFRLNPNARIQADTDYRLQLWVERPALPDLQPWQQGVERALAEWRENYPNVAVELSWFGPGQAAAALQAAIDQGTPPDLYFNANSSQSYFGELQLPLSRYVDQQERLTWADGLWRQAAAGDTVFALPVAAYPQVFLANQQLLTQLGFRSSDLATQGWSWPELLTSAQAVSTSRLQGYLPVSTGESLLRCLAAGLGKPAACIASGEPSWTRSDLISLAETFERLRQSSAADDNAVELDANCLELFLQQRAAVIGPVNQHLASWLWSAAVAAGITPELLPIPGLAEQPYSDICSANLALFRQADYQGHDHTRAAAELAQLLAPRLGELLASLTGALPATGVTEAAAWLPFDPQSFQVYAAVDQAPPLPYSYGPNTGVADEHWRTIVLPAWDKLVQGSYTPEQFAESILTELALATISGP